MNEWSRLNERAVQRCDDKVQEIDSVNAQLEKSAAQARPWHILGITIGLPYSVMWVGVNAISAVRPEDLPLSYLGRVLITAPMFLFGYALVHAKKLTDEGDGLLAGCKEKYWPGQK